MSREYTPDQVRDYVEGIRENIEFFKRGVDGHIRGEVVLVVGSTGAGKSTIMNVIANPGSIGIRKDHGSWGLDVVGTGDERYAGEIPSSELHYGERDGFTKMKIGFGGNSTTKFPNYVIAGGKQFWDCPGFGDSDPATEISNMYYVNHIMKSATGGVRFVIVQSHGGTEAEGGKLFRRAIDSVCKMFPSQSPEALIDASTFVFTKVGEDELDEDYLSDVLERVAVDRTPENERVVTFLEVMSKMYYDERARIKHIEVTKVDGAASDVSMILAPVLGVVDKILSSDSAIEHSDVGFTVSDGAQVIALKLEQCWQKEMQEKCTMLIPLIKQVFEQIEREQGALRVKLVIEDLLKVLKINTDAFRDGGGTRISIGLIEHLSTLSSSNHEYQTVLSSIKETLGLIEFIGGILSEFLQSLRWIQVVLHMPRNP